jgi:hypothetical protein
VGASGAALANHEKNYGRLEKTCFACNEI